MESIYNNTSNNVLFEQPSKSKNQCKYNITITDIIIAYSEARKHKRNTASHIKFEQELFKNLYQLFIDVRKGNYKLSKSTCFVVTRPKAREVFAADFRDRIIHHVIIGKLMPCFQKKFINNSFSCMPGKGNYYGIKQLSKSMKDHPNGFVYKFDISGFFMNINKDKLFRLVRKFIKENYNGDKELLIYLSKLVILHHPENNCEIHGDPKLW